jgi:hypothetical protein
MRRSLALLIPAVALAAACTQSPTAATKRPTARFDGGLYYGSGNLVDGGNTMGSGNAADSDASEGGIFIGGGGAASVDGGGIFLGGGHITDAGSNAALVDSAVANERGGNYFGSGN